MEKYGLSKINKAGKEMGNIKKIFFDDKRVISFAMLLILIFGITVFVFTDQRNNDFLKFGPSEKTKILGMVIDTYPRYYFSMIFGFIITICNDYFEMSLEPFIINTLFDHKVSTFFCK